MGKGKSAPRLWSTAVVGCVDDAGGQLLEMVVVVDRSHGQWCSGEMTMQSTGLAMGALLKRGGMKEAVLTAPVIVPVEVLKAEVVTLTTKSLVEHGGHWHWMLQRPWLRRWCFNCRPEWLRLF